MKRTSLVVVAMLFALISLVSTEEKKKLPDYTKWQVIKYEKISLYSTYVNGCKDLELKGLSENDYNKKQFPDLIQYQYRDLRGSGGFLDVIKDNYNHRELIFYKRDLFEKKKRFLFFGHKWQYIDTFPLEESGKFEEWVYKISAFQLKHCLFFLTQ